MPQLDAIVNGITYALSNGAPFAWLSADEGMADVRRMTDRGPLQHGDSDYDFRLEPTTYPMGFRIYATSMEEQWIHRTTALRIFRPSRTAIQLRWTLETGAVRQLDVHLSGRLLFGSKDSQGYTLRFVAPLRAADPTFYDPTAVGYTFGVNAGTTGWAYPITFDEGFGSSTVAQTRAIVYNGSWRTSPIVTIKGPITNPVITNVTTGDKLDFTGLTIGSGTIYTIDCRAGVKTVLDQLGASQIANLTDDSDLATFSLEADVVDGINTISVTGSAANATTEVYLQYYERYVGI